MTGRWDQAGPPSVGMSAARLPPAKVARHFSLNAIMQNGRSSWSGRLSSPLTRRAEPPYSRPASSTFCTRRPSGSRDCQVSPTSASISAVQKRGISM